MDQRTFDSFVTMVDAAIETVASRLGVPSDSIIMCQEHDDDTAAARLTREQWERVPDDVKWQLVWVAHATLEAKGIWS